MSMATATASPDDGHARDDGARASVSTASSLREWMRMYTTQYGGSITHTIEQLLEQAFPTLWSDAKTSVEIRDDWDVIIAVLEAVHEAPLYLTKNDLPFSRMTENACNSRSFERLMEFLLGALVQGEERATVVRDIMTMDDVVQTDLKLAIERVMNYEPEPPQAQEPSGEVSDLWDNRDKATETQRSDPASPISNQISGSPRAHTPLYLSRNADLERAQRENNILKDENIHMVRELEDAMQKYENARQTNKELEEQVERLMLGLEVEVMKKERAVRSLYDERLQQLQKELDETRQELHDKSLVASEVKSLRDEVDLLRPAADKTAKLESTLSKYRTKIEELTCVKEQLRRLEDTNAELVEKQLQLETQLSKGASLQRKLTEAKEANTTISFRVSEVELELSRKDSELTKLANELDQCRAALQEAKSLNEQLRDEQRARVSNSAAQLGAARDGTSSADGISELNPEIMHKITRLEHENEQLRLQVDGQASERIDTLLDQIDDLDRLKKNFETKFFETRDTLTATKATSEETLEKLADTEVTLSNEQKRSEFQRVEIGILRSSLESESLENHRQRALVQQLQDKLSMELEDHETRLVQLTEKHADELEQLHSAHQLAVHNLEVEHSARRLEWQHEVGTLNKTIAERKLQMAELKNASAMKEEELLTTMNMVEEAHLKRQECLKAEHAEDITRVREAMEELEKQHRQYEITHSKSDAEMRQREEELRQRIARMESETNEERAAHATEIKSLKTEITVATLQAQQDATLFKEQERTLKDTIRAQLTATTALNETNQRLKSEVQKKSAAMIQLENRTATLESKLLSLEKERAHYTNQEERHRGAHAVDANYSSQLNSHVARVMSEFEALNEAHKALKANCRCSKEGPSRAVSKSNEADGKEGTTGNTSYYIDRLVKMKEQVSQEEDKRRELLFVNAQLILEQKQFQVKNKQQSEELRQLKEKLQTWLLRDERRRKEHEDLQLKVHALEGRLKQSSAQSIPQQSMASKSERDVQAPTEPHDAVETTIPGIEFPVENRSDVASPTPSGKRQREEDENIDPHVNDNDSKRAKVASEAGEGNESTFVAKLQASSQPPAADTETNTGSVRPKRRLSHFMSKRMQTSAATPSNPAPDKPSECQQQ